MFIYAGTTNGTLLTIDVASRYVSEKTSARYVDLTAYRSFDFQVINRMQVATTTLKQLAFDRSGR